MQYVLAALSLAAVALAADNDGKPQLSLPQADLCASRTKHFNYKGHNYLFSWQVPDAGRLTWFQARNYCRDRCMDLVSMETGEENEQMKRFVENGINDGESVWTSGRLCNFNDDCKREDLQPVNVNGWFWATPRIRMLPTDQDTPFSPHRAVNDWSKAGRCNRPQPDHCSERVDEACMSIGKNLFRDGVKWHDETCEDQGKMFICEDSDELVNFVRFNNKHLDI